jgi:hypothetical protein
LSKAQAKELIRIMQKKLGNQYHRVMESAGPGTTGTGITPRGPRGDNSKNLMRTRILFFSRGKQSENYILRAYMPRYSTAAFHNVLSALSAQYPGASTKSPNKSRPSAPVSSSVSLVIDRRESNPRASLLHQAFKREAA